MPDAVLSDEVVEFAGRAVLAWLATADADGAPNVSPKELFAIVDGHVVVANVASPRSALNLAVRPEACLSFVDAFAQKGFKVTGTVRAVAPGEADFARWSAPLRAMAGDTFVIRSVFVLAPKRVEAILAPSYRFVPGTTEASQSAAAMARYGVVRPAPSGGTSPLPAAATLLAFAAFAIALLLSGSAALEVALPGGLPAGNALVALALVAIAAAGHVLGTGPRWLARGGLVAALAWLPASVLLAGNLALNFGQWRGTAWFGLSLVTALVVSASLATAIAMAGMAALRRGPASLDTGRASAVERPDA